MGNFFGRVIVILLLFTAGFILLAVGLRYSESQKNHVLVFGAGSQGGESYELANAIAELAKKYDPQLNIIVAETGGSGQNNRMMQANHLQFATLQADTKAGPDTRLITMLYPDAYQLLVRDDQDINSIADLRGKTMGLPSKSSGQYRSFFFLAEHYGLRETDINVINMSSNASAWALSQGAIDGIFRVRAPGNTGLKSMIQKGGVKLLPIEHSKALRLEQPAIRAGQIPSGSYQGYPAVPNVDLPTPTVQRLLVTSVNVDSSVVERVTTLIYENKRELTDYSPLAGFLANPSDLASSSLPIHEGAEQYFSRDDPSFLQENVEIFAFYITLLVGVVSMLLQINGRRQKERVDAYNRELIDIYNQAVDDNAPDNSHYRNAMMDIFARVLKDSEDGNISSNGFEFLSFAWDELNDAIIEIINERKSMKGSG